MFKNINFNALYLGLTLLIIDVFIIWQKISYLYSNNQHRRVVGNIDDTFIGYLFYLIIFIISLSVISYAFSFKSRFSLLGKYIYELIKNILLKQLGKK